MNKKMMILALSITIILAASFFYFNNPNKEDTQLRNKTIEIETNMALTNIMRMSFDELVNKTEPYILSYYKETYLEGLKEAYERRGLVPYITPPPYYQYISAVYTSDDHSVKQIFVKFPFSSTIGYSTKKGAESQIAKKYTFKKENDQWKVSSVNVYILSIGRNEPKRIIEMFTNYNNKPIEYESIKILE